MFGKPSLMTRIATGKLVGFIFGLIGFFIIPLYAPHEGLMFRFAFLFWYTTLGAIVGVFGVVTYHPILKLPMPWWCRSFFMGAWMNFMLVAFMYYRFSAMAQAYFGPESILACPWWLVLEGGVIGLVCGYFATRFGGEGKETADMDKAGA